MTLSPIYKKTYIVVYDLHVQSYDYLVIGLLSREVFLVRENLVIVENISH